MSSNSTARTRSERVATIQLKPHGARLGKNLPTFVFGSIRDCVGGGLGHGLLRQSLAATVCFFSGRHPASFPLLLAFTSRRSIKGKTESLRAQAAREVICVYDGIVSADRATSQWDQKSDFAVASQCRLFGIDHGPEREILLKFLPNNDAEPSISPQTRWRHPFRIGR